jgi:catechol 2,3-dioxygenase-like lactoylglutathione lyase family enzyme
MDDPTTAPRAGQLHHVVINVRNLDVSLAFYRDGLGLQYDGSVEVGSDAVSTLVRLPQGARGRNAFLSAGHGMGRVELVEWAGSSDRFDARADRPPRTGGDPGVALRAGARRLPVVEDPDGIAIEFFALSD